MIAVGHKILIAAYIILKDKVEYKDLGGDYLKEKKKVKKVGALIKQLHDLGLDVMVTESNQKESA